MCLCLHTLAYFYLQTRCKQKILDLNQQLTNEKVHYCAIEKHLDDQLEKLQSEKATIFKECNDLRKTNNELIENLIRLQQESNKQEITRDSNQDIEHSWGYSKDQFEIIDKLFENGKLKYLLYKINSMINIYFLIIHQAYISIIIAYCINII